MLLNRKGSMKISTKNILKLFGKTNYKKGLDVEQETAFESRIEKQFDSYCKKIIINEYKDYLRKNKRRIRDEISISEVSENNLKNLSVLDFYEGVDFNLLQGEISIYDEDLYFALKNMPNDIIKIIVMAYFNGMNDREIAELTESYQQQINRKRHHGLKRIRKIMEGLV